MLRTLGRDLRDESIVAKAIGSKGLAPDLADEFLGLTKKEAALVEMKLALADAVKAQREKSHLSSSQAG